MRLPPKKDAAATPPPATASVADMISQPLMLMLRVARNSFVFRRVRSVIREWGAVN